MKKGLTSFSLPIRNADQHVLGSPLLSLPATLIVDPDVELAGRHAFHPTEHSG